MPFPQNTPPQNVPTTRGLGKSDTATTKKAFAGPINNGVGPFASIEALRENYEKLVMNKNDELTGQVAAYYGITGYSPDYENAPNLKNVETGPAGLPGSPYIPNIASPGEGSTNPFDLPTPPEGVGVNPSNVPFSGVPITENSPDSTSSAQSKMKIGQGQYTLGKSKSAS
jgi:hypothetical protein